jgi:hypothetical protein
MYPNGISEQFGGAEMSVVYRAEERTVVPANRNPSAIDKR